MADIYPAELGKLLDKFGLHPGVETFIARLPQDRLIRLVLAMERCSNNTELASSIAGLLVSSLSEDASGARALNEIWLEAFVTEETDPRHPAVDQAIRTLIGQWVIVHGYHPMELGGGGSCGAKRDEAVRTLSFPWAKWSAGFQPPPMGQLDLPFLFLWMISRTRSCGFSFAWRRPGTLGGTNGGVIR